MHNNFKMLLCYTIFGLDLKENGKTLLRIKIPD